MRIQCLNMNSQFLTKEKKTHTFLLNCCVVKEKKPELPELYAAFSRAHTVLIACQSTSSFVWTSDLIFSRSLSQIFMYLWRKKINFACHKVNNTAKHTLKIIVYLPETTTKQNPPKKKTWNTRNIAWHNGMKNIYGIFWYNTYRYYFIDITTIICRCHYSFGISSAKCECICVCVCVWQSPNIIHCMNFWLSVSRSTIA